MEALPLYTYDDKCQKYKLEANKKKKRKKNTPKIQLEY